MQLEALIKLAKDQEASDLHLEPGLPAALRIRGALRLVGEPLPGQLLLDAAQGVLGPEPWRQFLDRRSFDGSRIIDGVPCRLHLLQSARGVGFAIRLLTAVDATLETLNLHPQLHQWVAAPHGLILVSGPTGSGKSSTLAALLQEINRVHAKHIITIESPIEYTLRPQCAYIRQREVGRDTPSVEQALLDALREDPDVLMVGELRDPATMRLTLNAAETGHLVLATVHSGTCEEALQRIVAAFPAEIQHSVSAQLADCLVGVLAQRLQYRADLKIRVPECEILVPNPAVKHFIRHHEFFKIRSTMETSAADGMWTFQRYRDWLDRRTDWYLPGPSPEPPAHVLEAEAVAAPVLPPLDEATPSSREESTRPASPPQREPSSGNRIEIEPVEGGWDEVLKKLGE